MYITGNDDFSLYVSVCLSVLSVGLCAGYEAVLELT